MEKPVPVPVPDCLDVQPPKKIPPPPFTKCLGEADPDDTRCWTGESFDELLSYVEEWMEYGSDAWVKCGKKDLDPEDTPR